MLVMILICAMATPSDECTEKTAERVIVLSESAPECSLLATQALMASLADMIEEGKEYMRVECRAERRV